MIQKIVVVFLIGLFASSSAFGRSFGEIMSDGANRVVPTVLSSRSVVIDFINTAQNWEVVGISQDGSLTASNLQDYKTRKESYLKSLNEKKQSALAALTVAEQVTIGVREEVQQLMNTYCNTIRTADSRTCNRITPFSESVGTIYTEVVLLKDRLGNIPGRITEEFVYITDTFYLNGFRNSDLLVEGISSLSRELSRAARNVELSPGLLSYNFGEQQDYYLLLYRLNDDLDR